MLHSWLFIDPSEHHYTTQTSEVQQWVVANGVSCHNVEVVVSCKISTFGFAWGLAIISLLYQTVLYLKRWGAKVDLVVN